MTINRQLLESIQEKRLRDSPFEEPYQLLGECETNAEYLQNQLAELGYSSKVVVGWFDTPRIDSSPENFKQAQKLGVVHYWVMTDTHHLDIVKEPDASVYMGKSPPSNYHLLDVTK